MEATDTAGNFSELAPNGTAEPAVMVATGGEAACLVYRTGIFLGFRQGRRGGRGECPSRRQPVSCFPPWLGSVAFRGG